MRNKVWKRCTASALALALVFTSTNFTSASEAGYEAHIADVLKKEYAGTLSDAEFALLKHPAIANSQSYAYGGLPTDAELQLVVDTSEGTTKVTVTAPQYLDENGTGTWIPQSGSFKDGAGEAVTFPLTNEDGDSNWTAELQPTSDSYEVSVAYDMPVPVSADAQMALLTFPGKMYADYQHLTDLNELSTLLNSVVTDGGEYIDSKVETSSDEVRAAWANIKDGNAIAAYLSFVKTADGYALSDLRDTVPGTDMTVAEALTAEVAQIGSDLNALSGIDRFIDMMIEEVVNKINLSAWNIANDSLFNGKTVTTTTTVSGADVSGNEAVSQSTFEINFDALVDGTYNFDQLVINAWNNKTDVVEATTKGLYFGFDENLVKQTDMYNIVFEVVANVVEDGKLVNKGTSFEKSFPGNTDAETIKAWVEFNYAEALKALDDEYKIDENGVLTAHYSNDYQTLIDSVATVSEAKTYTLTFAPVKYEVTGYAEPVDAGTTIVLESCAEEGKAFLYTVNGKNYVQGAKIAVWEDLTISSKKVDAMELNVLVYDNLANLGVTGLTAEQNAILQYVLENEVYGDKNLTDTVASDYIYIQAPAKDEAKDLIDVTYANGEITVTAKNKESGIAGIEWVPATLVVNFENGAAPVSYDFDGTAKTVAAKSGDANYTSVDVVYAVSITAGADTFAAGEVQALVNLPNTLVEDAEEVLDVLELLVGNYKNLEQATPGILGQLGKNETTGTEVHPEVTKIVKHLFNAKYTANGKTYGYFDAANEYLQLYKELEVLNQATDAEKLSAYYKNPSVVANIEKQLLGDGTDIVAGEEIPANSFAGLVEVLNELVKYETEIKDFMDSMQAGASEKFGAIKDLSNELNKISAMPEKNVALNTEAAGFNALCEVLVESLNANTAKDYTVSAEQLAATSTLSVDAEGIVRASVKFVVNSSKPNVAATEKTADASLAGIVPTFSAFDGLSNADIIAWVSETDADSAYGSLMSGFVGLEEAYDLVVTLNGVACAQSEIAGKVNGIQQAVDIVYTWTPKTFEYTVDGVTSNISYDNGKIVLDASSDPDIKITYTLNGKEYATVVDGKITIDLTSLSASDFVALFANGATIEVNKTDVVAESVEKFVTELNDAIAKGGMSTVAELLLVDGSIVLKLGPDVNTVSTSGAGSIGQIVLNAPFDEVTVSEGTVVNKDANNSPVIYVQPIIDVLLNSGLDNQFILDNIDANGIVKEGTLADKLGYNGKLGAVLAEDELSFTSGTGSVRTYDFYVTIADDDASKSNVLSQGRRVVNAVTPYVNVLLDKDAVNVDATVPQRAYGYYLAAMLVLGQTDLSDVTDVELDLLLDYEDGIFQDVFNPEVDAKTIQNTINKLGLGDRLNILGREKEINTVLKYVRAFVNMSGDHGVVEDNGDEYYNYPMTFKLREFLKEQLGDKYATYGGYFGEDELKFQINLDINSTEYAALVVNTSGISVIAPQDAAAAIGNVPANSVVVLLTDITGDITFANKVYLDLNGKDIDGDITANAAVTIMDSTLGTNTAGEVSGDVSGSVSILAGIYADDVTAFLPNGYVQDGGMVRNEYYTMASETVDGVETVTVTVLKDVKDINKQVAFKKILLDVVYDLGLNFYTAAGMDIDGNNIYKANVNNVIDSAQQGVAYLANQVLNGNGVEADATLNLDGLNAFINAAIDEVADLETIADTIRADGTVIDFDVTTEGWKIDTDVVGDGDNKYIDVDILTDGVDAERKLVIKVDETVKEKVADEVDKLAAILTIDTATDAEIESVAVANGAFVASGNAHLKATLDLTKTANTVKNRDWAAFLGKMVYAYNGNEAILTAANDYLNGGSRDALKAELDKLTVKEIYAIIAHAGSMTQDEIKANATDAEVKEYALMINYLGKVLSLYDLNRGSMTLGSFDKDNDGVYTYVGSKNPEVTLSSYFNGEATLSADLTLILFFDEEAVEPTPTPGPEVTPTPGPEVTPTPGPEVTPTPGPAVTPAPSNPTPAPTQAPQGTSPKTYDDSEDSATDYPVVAVGVEAATDAIFGGNVLWIVAILLLSVFGTVAVVYLRTYLKKDDEEEV